MWLAAALPWACALAVRCWRVNSGPSFLLITCYLSCSSEYPQGQASPLRAAFSRTWTCCRENIRILSCRCLDDVKHYNALAQEQHLTNELRIAYPAISQDHLCFSQTSHTCPVDRQGHATLPRAPVEPAGPGGAAGAQQAAAHVLRQDPRRACAHPRGRESPMNPCLPVPLSCHREPR